MAALAYGWGMGNVNLEPFYGAAARSMSESWFNWFFGSVDPWGTVSVDKLPGALWVQALSLRVFGFHLWALVLPQVVEGTLTVLVLYRAVRRLAGAGAALVAAVVLALSPITVLLNRGNVSDSLLILLLVLAADATSQALVTGRLRSLVLAGLWVGLAFQTKMLQAWLVLPAIYLAYLVAAPAASLLRRTAHVALSVLVVVVVSLSWMTAVSLVPAHDRPYVDGSCDNSVFSQVFLYNGLDRFSGNELTQADCSKPWAYQANAAEQGLAPGLYAASVPPGWDRLFTGVFGRDDAWMAVPTVVSAAALLVLRRRRRRTDRLRASAILWTTWLLITGAFFSAGHYLNSYYVAALIPPMAALCGLGAVTAWRMRHRAPARAFVGVTVLASTAYALYLLPADVGVRAAIIASSVAVSTLAVGTLAMSLTGRHRSRWTVSVGLAASSAALVLGSAWASGTAVSSGIGPFDSPYEPASVILRSQATPARVRRATWPKLNYNIRNLPPGVSALTEQGSGLAGYLILATGKEFLPVGGFSGQVPAPSLPQFIRYAHEGRIPLVTVAIRPLTPNPDMQWVVDHCTLDTRPKSRMVTLGTVFQLYYCLSAPVRRVSRATPAPPTPAQPAQPTPAQPQEGSDVEKAADGDG
jgi:4-amino-4-deoxy-L-arabinose transferase-like glycosyltransferase